MASRPPVRHALPACAPAPRPRRPRDSTTRSSPRDEARALALDAQGFGVARPRRAPRAEDVLGVVERLRLLQIDSVNVLVRAHYMPAFSRLGPYDPALLDHLTYERRALFEFWAHEASIVPVRFHPLLRWRMDRGRGRASTASAPSVPSTSTRCCARSRRAARSARAT